MRHVMEFTGTRAYKVGAPQVILSLPLAAADILAAASCYSRVVHLTLELLVSEFSVSDMMRRTLGPQPVPL